MTAETLLFFGSAPEALALYERLEEMILSAFPDTRVVVQKSQIAFDCGRRFAFASLRGKRLVVSFGLGRREESPRIAQAVEPYPGRWTDGCWRCCGRRMISPLRKLAEMAGKRSEGTLTRTGWI